MEPRPQGKLRVRANIDRTVNEQRENAKRIRANAFDKSNDVEASTSSSKSNDVAASTSSSSSDAVERLEQFLVGLYNDGKLSTAQFQKAAALAQNVSASKVGDRLAAVASLGANGVWSGNAFRDFARRIGRSSNMPDLYEADVPCWDHEKDMQTFSKMYFLLPHEL